MDLGKTNKQYWMQYAAGSTPGIEEIPEPNVLACFAAGARVLDVGTGTGTLAEYLSGLGYHVSGIDVNPQEISANARRASPVSYSVRDITEDTGFMDSTFDLVIFRYTLTNIHVTQWHRLSEEIRRIVTPGGYVWLAEPYVNKAYAVRYELGREKLGDAHALYVFKDKERAGQITSVAGLEAAEANGEVARIVRHYDEQEIRRIFPAFTVVTSKHVHHVSPSGYPLDTFVALLQKA